MIPRNQPHNEILAVDTYEKNGVLVFAVKDALTVSSSFEELAKNVQAAISQGAVHIAFSFTGDSYLNTRLIANLVHFWKLVQDHGGSMGLIRPNSEIRGVLDTIGLTGFIAQYASQDDIRLPPESGSAGQVRK